MPPPWNKALVALGEITRPIENSHDISSQKKISIASHRNPSWLGKPTWRISQFNSWRKFTEPAFSWVGGSFAYTKRFKISVKSKTNMEPQQIDDLQESFFQKRKRFRFLLSFQGMYPLLVDSPFEMIKTAMNHPFEPLRSYLNKRCCSVCNVCHVCLVQLIEIMTRTLPSIYSRNSEKLLPQIHSWTTNRRGRVCIRIWRASSDPSYSSGIFWMIFRKLPSSPKVASLRRVDSFLKNQHMDVHYLSLWGGTNINDVHKKNGAQSTYAIWQKRMPKQGVQQAPVISLHQKPALP